ncbi:zinc metalloprotease [Marmoricola sp. RAF53]|uniref:zinc metalloprotease n=1 Tax=Marmoricola sp. RAF53 TaxID=3233059 RepID=UPI003F9D9785
MARFAGVGAAAVALLSLSVLGTGAAQAVARPASSATVPCAATTSAARTAVPTSGWRRSTDTLDLSSAERTATQAQLGTSQRTLNRSARTEVAALASRVVIPVYVHVIQGSHRKERTVNVTKVRRTLAILRGGFAGTQAAGAARTRYSFTIKKINFVKNDKWYHASLFSKADRQMKTKMHRGGSRSLNLYLSGARADGLPLLGYSRFPWQYRLNPKLDSVTVNVDGLTGGRANGYNLGDTVIHEVGHWMGLFHTFEGGCSEINDAVADTPAEKAPNYRCADVGHVCDPTELATKVDPAYNFMDYSLDQCMRMFTEGQASRMDAEFALYRS